MEGWRASTSESDGKCFLLLGEGNFSFASCFLQEILDGGAEPGKFLATAFGRQPESDDACSACVRKIEENGGTVIWGVDATALESQAQVLKPPFDCVIFNFPHVGGKMRLDKNRELLAGFLRSVTAILRDERSEIWLSLCGGQGGTDWDRPKRTWNDSWQLPLIASRCGLMLHKVLPFPTHLLPYRQTGYRGLNKPFLLGSALTHVLRRPSPVSSMPVTLPPWLQLVMETEARPPIPYDRLSFSETCVPCDSRSFLTFVKNHRVTRDLTETLSPFGALEVTAGDVAGEELLGNRPPCNVFLDLLLRSADDRKSVRSAVVSHAGRGSEPALDFPSEIVRYLEPTNRVRVDLVRFFVHRLNLDSWGEILALRSRDACDLCLDLGALTYVHHLSVWTGDGFDEPAVLRSLFERFGLVLRNVRVLEECWRCPDGTRTSRLYEMTYRCRVVPFSDASCREFHTKLLPWFLKCAFGVIVR